MSPRRAWSAPLALTAALAAGCTSVEAPRSTYATSSSAPVTLLAFGDSGYHHDYLELEDYETVVSEQQFMEKERLDWIEDKRPIEELAYPPTYRLPRNGSTVAASGLAPVAKAMKTYCTREATCDLAAMLGDNIYPDGATADADGRDAERFRDLFVAPFGDLGGGREGFRIYSVLGNHDWRTSREGAMAQVRFLERTAPFYMDGIAYRVTPSAARGEIELFAIDTEVLLSSTTVYKAKLADDASELTHHSVEKPLPWAAPQSEAERNMVRNLEEALRNSKARWKVVLGHHPLWSTSGGKFEQARALRALILPTLCRYADVYLAGHEHTQEVHTDTCAAAKLSDYVDPLLHVVTGSAAKMRPTNTAFIRHQLRSHPELRTLYARGLTWGFAHLTFEREKMTVRIVETPTDGSGATHVTFQQTFARRRQRSPD
jgi:tartrate-resistant acid phosphatase type 5